MDNTYERIMARCMARVPQTLDKREGSIIFDAMAPLCMELAQMYIELSTLLDRAFPDTAVGADLDKKAAERGLVRLPATCALCQGSFVDSTGQPMSLEAGLRFSGGSLNYVTEELVGPGLMSLRCESPGAWGSRYSGTLFPIDYVEGLASASLSGVLLHGEDEESDEALRLRVLASYRAQAYGGNVADYRQRVGAIAGVGGVKVVPCHQGGGTVKVVVIASDGSVPSTTLVNLVQTAVDPVQNGGQGLGIAPIGHVVTVEAVIGQPVDLALSITPESGYTLAQLRPGVEAALEAYLAEERGKWADSAYLTIRVSQVESRLLEVAGVLDAQGTRIGGAAANLPLGPLTVPLLGTVTLEEANHAA